MKKCYIWNYYQILKKDFINIIFHRLDTNNSFKFYKFRNIIYKY